MPKLSKDFPCTLNFGVELALKQNLIAAGYLMRHGGEYASISRNLLWEACNAWLRALPADKRKEFDAILENVKIQITK